MKNSKPFFSKDVEDRIVEVIFSELKSKNMTCDEKSVRKYVQASKSPYENAVLADVAAGIYVATVQDGQIAYRPASPHDDEVEELSRIAIHRDADHRVRGLPGTGIPTNAQIRNAILMRRTEKLTASMERISESKKLAELGVKETPIIT